MDLCKEDDITEQDHVEEWPEGFKVVIDQVDALPLRVGIGHQQPAHRRRLPVQESERRDVVRVRDVVRYLICFTRRERGF